MNPVIRLVEPQDNPALEKLVVSTLMEFGCCGPGYASEDPEIQDMYTTYNVQGSRYWVITDSTTGKIIGGGGFARLKGTTEAEGICELQKLYFLPETRGHGLGKRMMQQIIEEATRAGYREMYLESVPKMLAAIGLYESFGFHHLDGPMGNTGHHMCPVHMLRKLTVEDKRIPEAAAQV
jgi:putative acetyltransferase